MDFVEVPILREYELVARLVDLLEGDAWICGGFARYVTSPHEQPVLPNDIDIFVRLPELYPVVVARLSAQFEMTYNTKISATFRLPHATFGRIQVVKPATGKSRKFWGTPQEILSGFDFTVICVAITGFSTGIAHTDYLKDEGEKMLRMICPHSSVRQFQRIGKYTAKGYSAPLELWMAALKHWESYSLEFRTKLLATYARITEIAQKSLSENGIKRVDKVAFHEITEEDQAVMDNFYQMLLLE